MVKELEEGGTGIMDGLKVNVTENMIHEHTEMESFIRAIKEIVRNAEEEKTEVGSQFRRECIDEHAYEQIRKMVLEEG